MELKLVRPILIIFLIILLQGCSKEKLPGSVSIQKGDIVKIIFKDQGYQKVLFGTDLYGNWVNISMQKRDSLWIIRFKDPHKKIQYKFFIDGIFWEMDPTNPEKERVTPPYAGYNSVIDFD